MRSNLPTHLMMFFLIERYQKTKMKQRYIFSWLLFFLCHFCWGGSSSDQTFLKVFPEQGGLRFEIQDRIQSPVYRWPRTLLSYPIDFSHVKVKASDLSFVEIEKLQNTAFQLSEIKEKNGFLQFAKVHFLTDLPTGATRIFELRKELKKEIVAYPHPISIQESPSGFEVDTGTLRVRLAGSKKFSSQENVSGPLQGIKRGGEWFGESKIVSPQIEVLSLQSELIERGPLFALFRFRYFFKNKAIYETKIRTIAGYDFLEVDERMTGLNPEDQVALESSWTRFKPTCRFGSDWEALREPHEAWPRIDQSIVTSYTKEDPHWTYEQQEDPAKEMLLRLSPYGGNGVREIPPHIAFWEDSPGGEELGIFVRDHVNWQDGGYSVWQNSTQLQIRFRYASMKEGGPKTLIWRWPLSTGSRSTGVALYDVAAGEREVENIRSQYLALNVSADRFDVKTMKLRYIQWLHSYYGFLSLDQLKDWVLSYPETSPRAKSVFPKETIKTPEEFEKKLFGSAFIFYPLGVNTWPGVNSISHRFVYAWVTEAYSRLQSQFTSSQRQKIEALMLLSSYVTAGEEMHPIRSALAGCPNMAADGWCVPMQMAYLFPEHPMAQEWRDQYEKTFQISSHFYTRPTVKNWESQGGRWTESLGTYNWAHFRPTSASQMAGFLSDGKNRWVNESLASRGQWLVDMLSAPIYNPNPYWRQNFTAKNKGSIPPPLDSFWKPGIALSEINGFYRQYPAHGAHGSGTTIEPPYVVHLLGLFLQRYSPLLSEHLLWISTTKGEMEGSKEEADWVSVEKKNLPDDNRGTPPLLSSCKYTGHGIVMRSGVNTPDELSIHLDQVDQGPNYRWGNTGEGASGSIYYYAQGKIYTGHERESAGDRTLDDTDGISTFGVMKGGFFRSIGMNVLEQPLYDLGVAQFAELTPRQGSGAYSWPEYKSRNILLVGSDYFILTDEVGSSKVETRFTWFVPKDQEFPHFTFLKPMQIRQDHWSEIMTPISKGFHRQQEGSSRVLVTHRSDVKVLDLQGKPMPYLQNQDLLEFKKAKGKGLPDGIYEVSTPTSHDWVFRNEEGLDYQSPEEHFRGVAGIIRKRNSGAVEMALFHSQEIGNKEATLRVDSTEMGISMVSSGFPESRGQFFSREGGTMDLKFNSRNLNSSFKFYIDGVLAEARISSEGVNVKLPAGSHRWELTSTHPEPMSPRVMRTVGNSRGAEVFWTASGGASRYRIELSEDQCATWKTAVETESPSGILTNLTQNKKYHIRLVAINPSRESLPGPAYPIYVTDRPPLPPDGLNLHLEKGTVSLYWGEVFGVKTYQLYRRQGAKEGITPGKWELIYQGLNNRFLDSEAKGVVKGYALPGIAANALMDMSEVSFYDYAVSAQDGNGEGHKGKEISTDPRGWLIWEPSENDNRFQRRTAYWDWPYVPKEMIPPRFYPE